MKLPTNQELAADDAQIRELMMEEVEVDDTSYRAKIKMKAAKAANLMRAIESSLGIALDAAMLTEAIVTDESFDAHTYHKIHKLVWELRNIKENLPKI